MTPKEKAIELVDKFSKYTSGWDYDELAKKCALIAVDEILNNVYRTPFRFTAVSSDELYRINEQCKHSLNMNILFLNSVKQEIELL